MTTDTAEKRKPVRCTKCGVIDNTDMTPRTNSMECSKHDWVELEGTVVPDSFFRVLGVKQLGTDPPMMGYVDSGGRTNWIPWSPEIHAKLEEVVERENLVPDLDAENELAELEVLHEMFIKPFYEEYERAIRQVLRGRKPGELFQAENGLVMCIREQDGHFTYNKPYAVARSMVHKDDRNTLAAKTMKESGFVPRIPIEDEDEVQVFTQPGATTGRVQCAEPNTAGGPAKVEKITSEKIQGLMGNRGMRKEDLDGGLADNGGSGE